MIYFRRADDAADHFQFPFRQLVVRKGSRIAYCGTEHAPAVDTPIESDIRREHIFQRAQAPPVTPYFDQIAQTRHLLGALGQLAHAGF